jgi:thymidylate kinase
MFIVIEGTDASGKTSLIHAVHEVLRRRYPGTNISEFHKGRPEQQTRRWVLNDYVTSIEKRNWFRLLGLSDRWHWGEVTYAPKYRPDTNNDGYGLLGKAGWRWVELYLMSRGVAQFWLHQPLDVIKARLEERGDEFVKTDDLEEILANYDIAAERSVLADVLKPGPDSKELVHDLAEYVVDRAREVSDSCRYLEHFPFYIGNPRPKVLLVGDQRNITKRHGEETTLPFMPVDGNSAEYLLSSLPEDLWSNVGIVNINDPDVKLNFTALWNQLGFPTIIVLGRLAEKTLMSIPVDSSYYTVLPHPQYVRRFFNSTKEEYGQTIANFADQKTNEKDKAWTLR